MFKKHQLRGCGSIHIENTPGYKDYTFESNEIIKKIDELKDAILESRLKQDNYNLIVNKPKDPEKGYYSERIKEEKSKKELKNITDYSAFKKLKNSVNASLVKYSKNEKLNEEDYKNLAEYLENKKIKNNKLPTIKDRRDYIKKIIDERYKKEEPKKQETRPTKEEIEEEIRINKLNNPKEEEIFKIKKPKKRITEEEVKENKKLLNDQHALEDKQKEKPIKRKRGRPKGTKNKPKKLITKKEDYDEEKGYGLFMWRPAVQPVVNPTSK